MARGGAHGVLRRWAVWCAVGLAVRVLSLVLLHNQTFIPDHLLFVEWATWAVKNGPLALYDERQGEQQDSADDDRSQRGGHPMLVGVGVARKPHVPPPQSLPTEHANRPDVKLRIY